MSKRVIKRMRHTEHYQRDKLQHSIESACLSVRDFAGAAELTAEHVCNHVEQWLENKLEVTSYDLRLTAGKYLQQYNPPAAMVYVTHMDIN